MNVSSVSPERCDTTPPVADAAGYLHGSQRLRQRSDLVDLHQDGVGDPFVDPAPQDQLVGDEDVVPHQLEPVTQALGQFCPALPVIFRHPVLDGHDRVVGHQLRVEVDDGAGPEGSPFELVAALLIELAGGHVEGQGDLVTGTVSRLLDSGL